MFKVIEGTHRDPNDITTLEEGSRKEYGPMTEQEANEMAKSLIQKNIDDYYHRAWVIKV
jgi:hypothetical protein